MSRYWSETHFVHNNGDKDLAGRWTFDSIEPLAEWTHNTRTTDLGPNDPHPDFDPSGGWRVMLVTNDGAYMQSWGVSDE